MQRLRKFTTEYNTPRVVQIFYTLLCATVIALVCLGSLRSNLKTDWGGSNAKRGTILYVFYYIFGYHGSYFFQYIINYIFMGIGAISVVLIWMNRPKLAAITPGIYLLTMLLTLLKLPYGEYYVEYNSYAKKNFYQSLYWDSSYTFAWIALVFLVALAIVAIRVTKKGARPSMPPKAVRVVNLPTPAIHTADDLIKYKELLDKGVITEEEYNAKKKQLLGL